MSLAEREAEVKAAQVQKRFYHLSLCFFSSVCLFVLVFSVCLFVLDFFSLFVCLF